MSAACSSPISRRPERGLGFTLVEAVAALAVSSLILAAVASFYLRQQRALSIHRMEIETAESLRVAIEQMSRDLRSAGRNPAGTDTTIGLTRAAVDEIWFTLDANNPGETGYGTADTNDANEHKRFKRDSATKTIQIYVAGTVSPWLTLAEWIDTSGSVFRYYDGSYPANEITALPTATASVLATIRRIDIQLRSSRSLPGGGTLARTETASVRLRNLP
jgi:type IV pilus assembly protein PilW